MFNDHPVTYSHILIGITDRRRDRSPDWTGILMQKHTPCSGGTCKLKRKRCCNVYQGCKHVLRAWDVGRRWDSAVESLQVKLKGEKNKGNEMVGFHCVAGRSVETIIPPTCRTWLDICWESSTGHHRLHQGQLFIMKNNPRTCWAEKASTESRGSSRCYSD